MEEAGAAFVSIFEFSELSGVVVEDAGAVFVSFLLEGCMEDDPSGVVLGVEVVDGAVVSVVVAVGVATVLVSDFGVSVTGVSLALLQPVKVRTIAAEVKASRVVGINFFMEVLICG